MFTTEFNLSNTFAEVTLPEITILPDFAANTDDFVDVTGLPDSCQDVIVYGACYRLLSFLDAGRINLSSAEADLNDTKIPSSAGSSVSKYVFALLSS